MQKCLHFCNIQGSMIHTLKKWSSFCCNGMENTSETIVIHIVMLPVVSVFRSFCNERQSVVVSVLVQELILRCVWSVLVALVHFGCCAELRVGKETCLNNSEKGEVSIEKCVIPQTVMSSTLTTNCNIFYSREEHYLPGGSHILLSYALVSAL